MRATILKLALTAVALTGVAGAGPALADDIYQAALNHTARSDADRARDAGRKPADVMAFLEIRPGMAVLDLFSGGGYYSELLSYVVGMEGQVIAHSNTAYLNFVGAEFVDRYKAGRLANVDILMAENNKLRLDPGQLDVIFMGLSYHDTYWVNPDGGWHEIDRAQLNTTLYQALKPGGVLGVTDHYAADGTGSSMVPDLHRIEKSIVIADLEAAGFELDAESDVLRNPDDDHSKSVFAPDTRGRTDRFVLKFRKPE